MSINYFFVQNKFIICKTCKTETQKFKGNAFHVISPYTVFVYCKNKWSKIKSDELLPGEYMMGQQIQQQKIQQMQKDLMI